MKEIPIISRTTPAKPRSANYPISSSPSGGGGTVSVSPGGGVGIDIIKTGDSTAFSDTNVLSSLRANDEFINRKKDSSVTAIVDYLKGLKINGMPVTRILNKDTEEGEFSDTDIMSALRVIAEIAAHDEELKKLFLSKTTNDRTPFKLEVGDKLTAEKGIQIGESFVPGIVTGSGGFFDKFANGEVESLIIRRFLEVPELRFNRVKIELGDKWNAPGAGIFESVEPDKDSEGNPLMTGTGYLKLEEGEYGAIAVGDICMGIFHSENPSDNASSDSDDSRGNFMFAGFYTCYFTITEITGSDNKQFRYQLRPVSDRWKLTFHPSAAMHFVSYGSFTDESRQTSQYTTRTYTRMLWKQNTWEISSANIAMQYGDLSNMSIHGLDMVGYSMYLNSVYFTGRIKEVKPDGTPIYRANDRGAWVSGTKYDFYDRVSHNGSIWLCVNESGTNSEPAKGNPDWLLQVEKGEDGKDGGQGPQGVPGPAGADGKTLYTWIRYADDAQGGGISNNPTGKAYIGFAYNKETATESNDPSDYTWSDIKGEDGIPGAAGADGKTYYTWVAYSDNADGTGMYQQPKDTTKYIGIAVNKETATESNNPSDYTWSKFKGEDGQGMSSLGSWYTGLIVPKLGIVTMGGSTFCAKVQTVNPPLWCVTDSQGRRILQTQDGGKTYGYILTGEMNTEEYDLLVQSGKDGSDGTDHEWIYTRNTTGVAPSRPSTSQTDDYVPSGWTDDPVGVSESMPYEYASVRTKQNGVWGDFSSPSLYAKWGFDGKGVKNVDVLYAISTSNSTAPTTGWQTDAPAWENGKYIWSKTVTTYSDDSVEETSPVCITGGVGATGKGVKTITEYYYMSTSATTLTGGSWSTTRPTWENGKYIWTKSIITYTDNTTSETPGICVTGEKGDSITAMGNWYTGLIVPKQGVVTMGGSSYIAKKETTNPPLWTVTDSQGRRILQTQDGGKTYGYILTGEMNSAEYDLLASKGEDGKPGADGKPGVDGKPGADGKQGIQGCIIRHSEWSKFSVQYRNDESLTSGTRYLDVALVKDSQSPTGWEAYKCKNTHTSSESNAPGTSGGSSYWEVFSMTASYIFTSLIIAKDASIDFMQGNQLLIKKSDGETVTAGLSGSEKGSKVRIWAGAHEPDDAPFRVLESGKFVSTEAEVEGSISARTMNLKVCTNSDNESPNGTIILYPKNLGPLPELEAGACQEMKMLFPIATRTPLSVTLTTASANVKIAPNGSILDSVSSYDIEDAYGYHELIGFRYADGDITYWCVFKN
jgi:hypothetical protein